MRLKRKKKRKMTSKKDFSIYDICRFDALTKKVTRSEVMYERKIRRWFASEFSCKYTETFNHPWSEILTHYFDDQLDKVAHDRAFDMMVDDYFPEFSAKEEEENQAFADSLVAEQQAQLEKKQGRRKVSEIKEDMDEISKKEPKNIQKPISMKFDMGNPDEE